MIFREEMLRLFEFGDEEYPDSMTHINEQNRPAGDKNVASQSGISQNQKGPASPGSCSSDKLMETLLGKHYPRWIDNYHEHETFCQENKDEKLTKEEQDMVWDVYKRQLEWKEVQRVSLDDASYDRRPLVPIVALVPNINCHHVSHACPLASNFEATNVITSKTIQRSLAVQRKCSKLAHLLTLRSEGTKIGCTTYVVNVQRKQAGRI